MGDPLVKRLHKLLWVIIISTSLPLISCQRSTAYRRDQNYYDDSSNYYANKGKISTQQIESVGQPRKRALVLNFWNDTPIPNLEVGAFAANELKRTLDLTKKIIIPPETGESPRTEDFVTGERIKVAQLMREGRQAGVAILMIGRIKRITYRKTSDEIGILRQQHSIAAMNLELKVFDVTAGREILSLARSAESSTHEISAFDSADIDSTAVRAELANLAARAAIAQMIPEILSSVDKISWEGRIVKVTGTKVYINAGKASGLMPGDILRVMTPGEDIHDSETAAFLGRAKGQMKGTLEVIELFGTDGAVGEIHTGGNPSQGDLVHLY